MEIKKWLQKNKVNLWAIIVVSFLLDLLRIGIQTLMNIIFIK